SGWRLPAHGYCGSLSPAPSIPLGWSGIHRRCRGVCASWLLPVCGVCVVAGVWCVPLEPSSLTAANSDHATVVDKRRTLPLSDDILYGADSLDSAYSVDISINHLPHLAKSF